MSSPACQSAQNLDSLCLISAFSVFCFRPTLSRLLSLSLSLSICLARSLAGLLRAGGDRRVFDWGGDAIIASRTGLALFSSSFSLLCFLCAHSPGFPLLMEFLKHGIMRGVNQDRENRQSILRGSLGIKEIYKGVLFLKEMSRMHAYLT